MGRYLRNVPTIAACAASLATLPAMPVFAGPPQGSYQQSCMLMEYDDQQMIMSAACDNSKDKLRYNGDWVYRYCVGDISNYYGKLRCTIDAAKKAADEQAAADKSAAELAAQQAAADAAAAKAKTKAQLSGSEASFAAAGLLVLGWMPNTATRYGFIKLMKTPEFGMADQAQDENIGLGPAIQFLKKLLQRPQSADLRARAANLAYVNVYGRVPTLTEAAAADAAMTAGQSWYAPLVGAEQQKMRGSAALRNGVIRAAYQDAMGRDPSAGDFSYWRDRPDDYAHLIVASRNYLYAANGVNDRIETTKRALAAMGKPTSDAAIKAAMIEYGPTRAIYSEMTAGGTMVLKLPGM